MRTNHKSEFFTDFGIKRSTFTFLSRFFLSRLIDFEGLLILLAVGRLLDSILSLRLSQILGLFNILYDLCCNSLEGFFDSLSCFGTGFEELHPVLLGRLLTFLARDYFLVFNIALVSQKNFLHVWLGVIIYLPNPILDIVEALLTGWVVSKDDTLCSAIVCLSDGPESLLTRRVPYLNFHVFTVQLNCVYLEVNAYKQFSCQV